MLGMISANRGNLPSSVELFRKAVSIDESQRRYHESLGIALLKLGLIDEATDRFRSAVSIDPAATSSHFHLGNAYLLSGDNGKARDCFETVLEKQPDHVDARVNLGSTRLALNEPADAIACFVEALELVPERGDIWFNLSVAERLTGADSEADDALMKALKHEPDSAEINFNVGVLYERRWDLEKSIQHYKKAAQLGFGPQSTNNLGLMFKEQGKHEEAFATLTELCGKADSLRPEYVSNLLMISNYVPDLLPETSFSIHKKWGQRLSESSNKPARLGRRSINSDRPVRVGYVSGDFRRHSVSYFIEPILSSHDPDKVAVFCYSDTENPDEVTERLRRLTLHWRDTQAMSDEQLAETIRDDEIDVLIDLAGHTDNNRLPVFAAKPAPVQATYLGYPNTTGLPEMDYRITDGVADPPPTTDGYHVETLVRLDSCFLCYQPVADKPPSDNSPVAHRGHITFGCFNILPKVNKRVLSLWARILNAVPDSHLLLKNPQLADAAIREGILAFFAENGVERSRLDLMLRTRSLEEHLSLYRRVDIALDTFPYNGTTTTFEALWMGVPVLTLAGSSHASRVGASILTHLGKPELIAQAEEEYVDKAIDLYRRPKELQRYKDSLCNELLSSPLMDPNRITKELEDLYRQWKSRSIEHIRDSAADT